MIRRVSVAAAPMAQWAKANLEFSRVLQRVSPLEAELQRLQASLEESQRLIKLYEEELEQLDAEVRIVLTYTVFLCVEKHVLLYRNQPVRRKALYHVLLVFFNRKYMVLHEQVSKLKTDFSKKTSEAESLKMSVEKAEATLSSARQLLDGLRGERVRWETQVNVHGLASCRSRSERTL